MQQSTDSSLPKAGKDSCQYCDKPVKSRRMCSGHYERHRRGINGQKLSTPLRVRDKDRKCQICGGEYRAKGLCNVHYMLKFHGKDGHLLRPCMVPHCKTKARARDFCGNHYHIYQHYGLTGKEYLDLLEKARFRCQICGTEQTTKRRGRLCVDHDHDTGEIRGMLCHGCNRGLGLLGDNIQGAIQYLSKSNMEHS